MKLKDWNIEAGAGNISGVSGVIIRGHNTDIDSSAEEDLWEQGGSLSYLTTSETMNIVSTSSYDSGVDTKAGAQSVLLEGIANDGALLTESVTLNGSTAVTTTGSFKRINSMLVTSVGSSFTNVGTITATASTAGTVQATMLATEGINHDSHYTVSSSVKFQLDRVEFNASKTGGGQEPIIEFKGMVRVSSTSAWIQLFDKKLNTAVADELVVDVPTKPVFSAGGEIRMTGTTNSANTDARSRMYGWVRTDL
jgi:hypothetical protein